AEQAQRQESEIIERGAVEIVRIVFVILQVQQEMGIYSFIVVKRFEAELDESNPGGDGHRQNKDAYANQFLVTDSVVLDSLTVKLKVFHWNVKKERASVKSPPAPPIINQRAPISSLTRLFGRGLFSGLRRGLFFRGDRSYVHCGRARRVSRSAGNEVDLHLTA